MALAVGSCTEAGTPAVAEGDLRAIQADGIFYNMETYLRRDGIRSGMVRADSAYQFTDSAKSYLWDMDMTLYYEDGRDRARIRADSAVLDTRTEELIARGNVVATVMDEGMQIETPELNYNPTAEQIWSDSATVITQEGSTTRGTCFRSDLQITNWEICNPVGDIPTGDVGSSGTSGSRP